VLYFSRAAIPCPKAGIGTLTTEGELESDYLIHVGIYAYQRVFLLQYSRMSESSYEQIEGLEQLRALQNRYRIKAVMVDSLPMHIDTPEDADNMCKLLRDYPDLTDCSY
jgi:3-deoxy-manno-octulosonate cytidylyltransferase (CMP-KDO synthetase)